MQNELPLHVYEALLNSLFSPVKAAKLYFIYCKRKGTLGGWGDNMP